MYNRHLDTFLAVAEAGSFAQAAAASFVSRTALIQQINLLEEHLGLTLLYRDRRGVRLTAAGQLLYEQCKVIKKISSDTIARCRSLQDRRQLRIGILPNLPLTLLAPICASYHRSRPETALLFVERSAREYISAFYNNEFDISADYLSRLVPRDETPCFVSLGTDHFDCAVPPQSPLASREYLTLEDLSGYRVGLLIANLTCAEDRLRRILMEKERNIEIVDVESFKKSLPLSYVMEDTLLLHYHINAGTYAPLLSRPLVLPEPLPVEIGLCYKKDAPPEVLDFVAFAQDFVRRGQTGILR